MGFNHYISRRRAKFKGINGLVNIRYGTELDASGEFILYNGAPMCAVSSQNAIDYFSQNDDGCGLQRGELVQKITLTLEKNDANHQKRWDRVWESGLCKKYKRPDFDEYWLWDQSFYEAPICDLVMIQNIVGE